MVSPLNLPILSPMQNNGIESLMQGMQAGFLPQTTAADIAAKQALAQYNQSRGGYYDQYGNYRQAQSDQLIPSQVMVNQQKANVLYPAIAGQKNAQAGLYGSQSLDNQAKAANTFQQAINSGWDPQTALQMAQYVLQNSAQGISNQPGQSMQPSQGMPAMNTQAPNNNDQSQQPQQQAPNIPAPPGNLTPDQQQQNTQQAADLQQKLNNLSTQLGNNQQQQQQFQESSPAQILNKTPQSIQDIPVSGPKLKTDVSFTRALENGSNFVSTLDNAYSAMNNPLYKGLIGSSGAITRGKNKVASYVGGGSPEYKDFVAKAQDLTLNAESMAKAFTNTNAFAGIKLNVDMLNPASDKYPDAQSQSKAVQDFSLSYADRLAQQLKMNYAPADRSAILKNLQQLQSSRVYQDAIKNPANVNDYGGYKADEIRQVMQAYNMTIPQAYSFVDEHAKGAK